MNSLFKHTSEKKDFWELSMIEWKNIPVYDFRFLVKKLKNSKEQANLAYAEDIKRMQKNLPYIRIGRKNQILESCKTELKNVFNDHTNKYLWDHQAKHVMEIALKRVVDQEELSCLEEITAINALRVPRDQNIMLLMPSEYLRAIHDHFGDELLTKIYNDYIKDIQVTQ
ncbi:hypothetical protein BDA99DRAFT_533488 [Phascolomyces articulosus]|uniref:Uncharacterized protein n=1 Tax=Phascolomyces articulosus TaxID=60185 RepID=A0AAD5K7I3_9FUNG|nr:hypothetical protein BDA99DRAFT_533488 [Phascolomyces articulosus]